MARSAKSSDIGGHRLRINSRFAYDDFPTTPIETANAVDLFEILEAGEGRRAAPIASQPGPNEWYPRIEGEPMADSILGRVASACRCLDIDGPNVRKWLAENRPKEG